MSTARNDDKGYVRGARGIDGNDGSDFVKWGKPEGVCKVTGSDGGPEGSKGNSAMLASAKGK